MCTSYIQRRYQLRPTVVNKLMKSVKDYIILLLLHHMHNTYDSLLFNFLLKYVYSSECISLSCTLINIFVRIKVQTKLSTAMPHCARNEYTQGYSYRHPFNCSLGFV